MKRAELSPQTQSVLKAARRLANDTEAQAVLLLAERPYDFAAMRKLFRDVQLLIAADKPDVQRAAMDDDVALVPLLHEPQTRQTMVSQALVEAIADELLQTGDRVITLYSVFERDEIDCLSIIHLADQLARLTSRDLQRLETQVPLETLRLVVDLAVEIGREGREGKPVGTLMVVGNHRKVLSMSHEQVFDPFRGYNRKERMLRDPRVRESIKELSQIDGAFVISADGVVEAAGRQLDAPEQGLTLSKGLGSRHWAAAAVSKIPKVIAVAVSESTGTVRLFQNGMVVLRIEPMDRGRGMKWHDVDTESPADS